MRIWLTVGLALAAGAAQAHDFWIQPQAFAVEAGGATAITLQVGDGAERQRSSIPRRRIARFEALTPDGTVRDLAGALTLGARGGDTAARFEAPGAHVLVLATDAEGRSRLPAEKFNAYLVEEGLIPALEARKRAGRSERDGSERYRRAAKAIVQVGDGEGAAMRPAGLPLEIVPLAWPRTEAGRLPVRVLFEGKALAGALVKLTELTELAGGAGPQASRRTDAAGEAVFAAPSAGAWRLSVVWTKPLGPDADADFETTFATLSFGVSAPWPGACGRRTAGARRPGGRRP